MRPQVFACLLLALALGAAPAPQQPDSFRDEHKDLDGKSQRPDKQVSDLTRSVASKLPHIGSTTSQLPIRNLIDERLFGAMEKNNVPHASLSSDDEFCRRVYLDLTGRIPTPEQLKQFVESADANKRDKLIDELLDSQAWV